MSDKFSILWASRYNIDSLEEILFPEAEERWKAMNADQKELVFAHIQNLAEERGGKIAYDEVDNFIASESDALLANAPVLKDNDGESKATAGEPLRAKSDEVLLFEEWREGESSDFECLLCPEALERWEAMNEFQQARVFEHIQSLAEERGGKIEDAEVNHFMRFDSDAVKNKMGFSEAEVLAFAGVYEELNALQARMLKYQRQLMEIMIAEGMFVEVKRGVYQRAKRKEQERRYTAVDRVAAKDKAKEGEELYTFQGLDTPYRDILLALADDLFDDGLYGMPHRVFGGRYLYYINRNDDEEENDIPF